MIKWVLIIWIQGVLPNGSYTELQHEMIMTTPYFETKEDCDEYREIAPDKYLSQLNQLFKKTEPDWAGFVVAQNPYCGQYDIERGLKIYSYDI